MKIGRRKRCGKCRSCGKTKRRFSHSSLDLRSTLPTTPAAAVLPQTQLSFYSHSNGPLCCFMAGKEHVTFAFMRGAALPDPEKLLAGTGKGVRHVKLRSVADVKRPGVKKLIAEAAKLNKKDPPSGVMVGMEKRKRKTNCRDWRNQSEGDSSCRRQAITRKAPGRYFGL